jgi:hypothetical protein
MTPLVLLATATEAWLVSTWHRNPPDLRGAILHPGDDLVTLYADACDGGVPTFGDQLHVHRQRLVGFF